MADNGIEKKDLTHKQRRFLSALLATRTEAEAAAAAKISPRTAARWLKMPHFREALRRAAIDSSRETVQATMKRLTDGQAAALDTLEEVMQNGKPNERLRAATAWLNIYADLKEVIDFEERIARLEKDLK